MTCSPVAAAAVADLVVAVVAAEAAGVAVTVSVAVEEAAVGPAAETSEATHPRCRDQAAAMRPSSAHPAAGNHLANCQRLEAAIFRGPVGATLLGPAAATSVVLAAEDVRMQATLQIDQAAATLGAQAAVHLRAISSIGS
jgi:hypothetical protein